MIELVDVRWHKVLLLHGINTRAGNPNWTHMLEAIWESDDVPFRISQWDYSGVLLRRSSAPLTWIPAYRRKIIADCLKDIHYVAGFSKAGGLLSIMGHSFAGQITQSMLEQGWNFHRIILLASAMDEKFDFKAHESQFDRAYIYWSKADEVIPWSTYGRQGSVGPDLNSEKAVSLEYGGMKHNHWTDPRSLRKWAWAWKEHLV